MKTVFNDESTCTPDEFEKMAKAYSDALDRSEFRFFENENARNIIVDEVFETLFKLRASYRFLNGFLGSDLFLDLTEKQIADLRKLFNYQTNHGFRVRVNSTKCLLNTISLESNLLLKLNILSQFDFLDELSKIADDRLKLLKENYEIQNVFSNLAKLSSEL